MKGVDSLALIEQENFERFIEVHEKYGGAPMYTTLNEYIDNELIVLSMQIENLRLKLQDILNKKEKEKENMELIKKTTDNKVDIVRAMNTTKSLQNFTDTKLTLHGVIIFKEEEEENTVTSLKVSDETGETFFINSISETVRKSAEAFIDAFDPTDYEEGLPLKIVENTSKGGRTFYSLDLDY